MIERVESLVMDQRTTQGMRILRVACTSSQYMVQKKEDMSPLVVTGRLLCDAEYSSDGLVFVSHTYARWEVLVILR